MQSIVHRGGVPAAEHGGLRTFHWGQNKDVFSVAALKTLSQYCVRCTTVSLAGQPCAIPGRSGFRIETANILTLGSFMYCVCFLFCLDGRNTIP